MYKVYSKGMTNRSKPLPSQSKLLALLSLDESTGLLTWRFRPDARKEWNSKFSGQPAFCSKHNQGYLRGAIDNVSYLTHRVVWKMMHGDEPEQIDHLNGNRADNRPDNLRSSCNQDNSRNQARRKNASGVSGIYKHKASGLWHARIYVAGKAKSLGYFHDLADARIAREKAKAEFGYSKRHCR